MIAYKFSSLSLWKRTIHISCSMKNATFSKAGLSLQIPEWFRRMTISRLCQWWFVSLGTLAERICQTACLAYAYCHFSLTERSYMCIIGIHIFTVMRKCIYLRASITVYLSIPSRVLVWACIPDIRMQT